MIRVCLLLLCWSYTNSYAQSRLVDSLNTDIANKTGLDKVITISELASVYRLTDITRAQTLADSATVFAITTKNAAAVLHAYSVRAGIYLHKDEKTKAWNDIDTCLQYFSQTDDISAKSVFLIRKARMHLAINENVKAIEELQVAQDLLKGKRLHQLEAWLYYSYFSAYSVWDDLDNEAKYAKLAVESARLSGNPNRMAESWQALATVYEYQYQKDKDTTTLNAALNAGRYAIKLAMDNEALMTTTQFLAIPALNIANIFLQMFPNQKPFTDSVSKYVELAKVYAEKENNIPILASCYGILFERAQMQGNLAEAEAHLNQALAIMQQDPASSKHTLAAVYEGLSSVAEQRNNYKQALEYQRAYMATFKELFNTEQAKTAKDLEAKYETKEKEQQILFLEKSKAFHKTQNYLYGGIAVALLAGLIFMFRSYHFGLRLSIEREKLLEHEKEEANLQVKLKEEEARLAEAEKEQALLRAQLQEEAAARLRAEQQVIMAQKNALQKEVMAGNLQLEQKNKVLQNLQQLPLHDKEVHKILKEQLTVDSDFDEIKTEFKTIHPDFYHQLQNKATQKLTTLDLKYCAYIYMKRSTKEMASMLFVEPRTIRMNKYRLKQKLGLSKEEDLEVFIRSLI